MKMKASTGRKLRYGATSVTLTALIVAVVIVVNIIFSLCVSRFSWYLDMTPEPHFTVSDEFYDLIGTVNANDSVTSAIESVQKRRETTKKNEQIHFFFMQEEDILKADEVTKYVVVNAQEIREKYRDGNYVNIEFVNYMENPRFFSQFLTSPTETINPESVIVGFGTLDEKTGKFDGEFRIRSLESFYVLNESDAIVAYNGEKAFASSILAVTKAESPLVCYTYNHQESVPMDANPNSDEAKKSPFLPLMNAFIDAGYKVQALDLSREEIPEACRILVVYDPHKDFAEGDSGDGQVDEIAKLDKFLENKKSLMVFMNPQYKNTPGDMASLEDFLAEWGMEFVYKTLGRDNPYVLTDAANSIDANGNFIIGEYVNNPVAEGWTESMGATNSSAKPQVLFPNATPIKYATENGFIEGTPDGEDYKIGGGSSPDNKNMGRYVYPLFTTSTATANVDGIAVERADKNNPFNLMMVSVETSSTQENDISMLYEDAFVLLCGSVGFASESVMRPSYGNNSFLLGALQLVGREPVPVGLGYKEFANLTIDTIKNADIIVWTLVLTIVPALAATVVGTVILIRRKYK